MLRSIPERNLRMADVLQQVSCASRLVQVSCIQVYCACVNAINATLHSTPSSMRACFPAVSESLTASYYCKYSVPNLLTSEIRRMHQSVVRAI